MEARPRIHELGGSLVVFFQARLDLVERWFESTNLPRDLVVAVDPTAAFYDALGTARPSWFGLMTSGNMSSVVRAYRAGFRPKPTNADMRRLGADFVVSAAGEIAFLHRATGADDRVPPDTLVRELERVTS